MIAYNSAQLVQECIARTKTQESLVQDQAHFARLMAQKMVQASKLAVEQRESLASLLHCIQGRPLGATERTLAEQLLADVKDASSLLSSLMNDELDRVVAPATPWLETAKKGQKKPTTATPKVVFVARPAPPAPPSKTKDSLTENEVLRAQVAQMTARVVACEDEIVHLRRDARGAEPKADASNEKELADTRAMLAAAHKRVAALENELRSKGASWQKEKAVAEKEMLRVLAGAAGDGRREDGAKGCEKKDDGKKKDRVVVLSKAMDKVRQLTDENQALENLVKRLMAERDILGNKVAHCKTTMREFQDGVQAISKGMHPNQVKMMAQSVRFMEDVFPSSSSSASPNGSMSISDEMMQAMLTEGEKFFMVKMAK